MKNILIIKTGALGDVVRTTPLLHVLGGEIHWLTSTAAAPLLPKEKLAGIYTWKNRKKLEKINFDLIINLEETIELATFAHGLTARKRAGIILSKDGTITYSKGGHQWYDMSLISKYSNPNERKWKNRKSYQYYLFEMIGKKFNSHEYYIATPSTTKKNKTITIGIEMRSGDIWPMKQWTRYKTLVGALRQKGYIVCILKEEPSLMAYMKSIDVCDGIVCGDTLAMHLALALGKQVVTLFTCTSPWEIHGYERMHKVISPELELAFYKRTYSHALASAIPMQDVLTAVEKAIKKSSKKA